MIEEFLSLVNSSSDSVFFIDRKGYLVGSEKRLWDVFPFSEVVRGYEEALKRGNSCFEVEEEGSIKRFEIKKIERFFLVKVVDVSCERYLRHIKREVVSLISHEVRTPLTVIKGNAEYLISYGNCEEVELLKEIAEKAEKISEIVSGVSRLFGKSSDFRNCSLSEIVDGVVTSLSSLFEKKEINLVVNVKRGLLVECDRALTEQFLVNLLDNAIKFTEKGGTVEISALDDRGEVQLIVRDSGRGIPEDLLPMVFEKYVKSPDSRGHGIGLFIVKQIADLHGWEVRINSEVGKGTAVRVSIPKGRE